MLFTQPLWLWALSALIIPILIHLFNFRRPKRLAFSNLRFVKQVNKQVVRRVRLKQWLLLALRLLALAALVLAFAGPIWRPSNKIGGSSSVSVVIIVDNSYSMLAGNEGGAYLQQARQLAQEIVRQHPASDEFLLAETGNLRAGSPFRRPSSLLEQLDQPLNATATSTSLADISRQLPRLFQPAQNPRKRVYVISDFQSSTVLGDTLKTGELPEGYELVCVPVGGNAQRNLYLSDARFEQLVIERDKPVKLSVVIHNDSPDPVDNVPLRLEIGGETVAIQSVGLKGNQQQTAELTFSTRKTGWLSGRLFVEDRPNEYDNARFFSFYVPPQAQVLVVEGTTPLPYLRVFYQEVATQFQAVFISERQLASIPLEQYRTVVLAGVTDISTGMAQRLNSWVNEGGGLMVFAGPDANGMNTLYSELNVGKFTAWKGLQQPLTLRKPDLQAPLFQGVFRAGEGTELDLPIVKAYQSFQPANGIQSTVLALASGEPLVHESRIGLGQLYTFTTLPDPSTTDWPLRTSFAPVLFRATLLLSNAVRAEFGQVLNSANPKRVRAGGQDILRLLPETNALQGEVIPEQVRQGGSVQLQFDKVALLPGTYKLMQRDSLLERVAFNLPEAESRLATPEDLSAALIANGVEGAEIMRGKLNLLRQKVQEGRSGLPFWKYFLLFAILCVLGEVAVSRLLK
jgi:hypothetical protein